VVWTTTGVVEAIVSKTAVEVRIIVLSLSFGDRPGPGRPAGFLFLQYKDDKMGEPPVNTMCPLNFGSYKDPFIFYCNEAIVNLMAQNGFAISLYPGLIAHFYTYVLVKKTGQLIK
jgi:hypothetical protein